jgi:predicted  nucleic acid-binding Zn-ribbon protein
MDSIQTTIDEWQRRVDENVHSAIESMSPFAPLQREMQTLRERIGDLEKKLGESKSDEAAVSADDELAANGSGEQVDGDGTESTTGKPAQEPAQEPATDENAGSPS